MDSNQQWQPIETAPRKTKVLVWGGAGVRFGYLDELDNWRASHHGPINNGPPKFWMPIPAPPSR